MTRNLCIAVCIVLVILLCFIDVPAAVLTALVSAVALTRPALVTAGRRHTGRSPHNALVDYTLGEFKRLGGFTTLGESVCRAAIYMQTKKLLKPCVGGPETPWLMYKHVALELDGLDEGHKLAFEYDGPQHYSFDEWLKMRRKRAAAFTSENVLDFYRARFYDRWKTKLCADRGIRLIRVSTWTPFEAMRAVVQTAATRDFSEGRPVDDGDVISKFEDVDPADSQYYPKLDWQGARLALPSAQWHPHPFECGAGRYRKMFDDDLTKFTAAVRDGLARVLPRGAAADQEAIVTGVLGIFDGRTQDIKKSAYPAQFAAVRAAVEAAAREAARHLCS